MNDDNCLDLLSYYEMYIKAALLSDEVLIACQKKKVKHADS